MNWLESSYPYESMIRKGPNQLNGQGLTLMALKFSDDVLFPPVFYE
ncbi:MAG: hypothetical protein GXO86_12960 [Chlorobi bacterium]|nr:hypothetical protein [Chlorobiota bacterium]